MQIQELFVRSNEELRKVIDQIQPDQWELQTPPNITTSPATLKESVRYHTYDDAWVPDVLAGKTKEEVGEQYKSLLETPITEIIATYDDHNARANAAVRDFRDLDKIVHLSYGDFPARDYLLHIISFRGFRVYDLAKLIGADTKMADDLVQGLTEHLSPVIDDYRKMGVFPEAFSAPDNADPQTKLLALAGRE